MVWPSRSSWWPVGSEVRTIFESMATVAARTAHDAFAHCSDQPTVVFRFRQQLFLLHESEMHRRCSIGYSHAVEDWAGDLVTHLLVCGGSARNLEPLLGIGRQQLHDRGPLSASALLLLRAHLHASKPLNVVEGVITAASLPARSIFVAKWSACGHVFQRELELESTLLLAIEAPSSSATGTWRLFGRRCRAGFRPRGPAQSPSAGLRSTRPRWRPPLPPAEQSYQHRKSCSNHEAPARPPCETRRNTRTGSCPGALDPPIIGGAVTSTTEDNETARATCETHKCCRPSLGWWRALISVSRAWK